jgi:hypothetical protein
MGRKDAESSGLVKATRSRVHPRRRHRVPCSRARSSTRTTWACRNCVKQPATAAVRAPGASPIGMERIAVTSGVSALDAGGAGGQDAGTTWWSSRRSGPTWLRSRPSYADVHCVSAGRWPGSGSWTWRSFGGNHPGHEAADPERPQQPDG